MACGLGYLRMLWYFAFILCIVIYILTVTTFGQNRVQMKELRIFVPEDLNYQDAFDEVMEKYIKKCNLMKIKTADLGSVYELYYNVVLDENANEKEIDTQMQEWELEYYTVSEAQKESVGLRRF